ncbi:MAG: polymer-forming cytoskeletal protein [Alphaproteobacteria bacterium]
MSSADPIDTNLDMPTPRKGPRAASLVSSDMKIEGSITCEGELQIDGNVKGDVKVARLTIGEHGEIEGSIVAESVECRGRVIGSVSAKQVRLHAQSHVDGDITHEQLAMEAGAFFQGRSLRLQRPAAPKPTAASAPSFGSSASGSSNGGNATSGSSTTPLA